MLKFGYHGLRKLSARNKGVVKIMNALFKIIILLGWVSFAWAGYWQDLWMTKNQQAQRLMNQGQFALAQEMYERDDWRATAAYRAKDFKQAASLYGSMQNAEGYYNQGNALANMEQYEQAIKAYDNTLAIQPAHQDALKNRKIVEEFLKKNKQDQDKQNQDKQDQDKQDQDKQGQDKLDQDKQSQDKQDQDKQGQDKQDQDKQGQDKQDQDKQGQDKQDQDKQSQDKQDQESNPSSVTQSESEREKQQAKEQWLDLIPDDPGELMRQKFLRDYWRKQHGWDL